LRTLRGRAHIQLVDENNEQVRNVVVIVW